MIGSTTETVSPRRRGYCCDGAMSGAGTSLITAYDHVWQRFTGRLDSRTCLHLGGGDPGATAGLGRLPGRVRRWGRHAVLDLLARAGGGPPGCACAALAPRQRGGLAPQHGRDRPGPHPRHAGNGRRRQPDDAAVSRHVAARRRCEPICRALGVPVPDRPFPHENTTADFLIRAEARGRVLGPKGGSAPTGPGRHGRPERERRIIGCRTSRKSIGQRDNLPYVELSDPDENIIRTAIPVRRPRQEARCCTRRSSLSPSR